MLCMYVFMYVRKYVFVVLKVRIGTICGLSCANLGSELHAANSWIVRVLAHAVLDVVTCCTSEPGNSVPRRTQAKETKFFFP